MMVDSSGIQKPVGKNPIELAIPVTERVQIENVLLSRCEAELSPRANLDREGLFLRTTITEIGVGKDTELKQFYVFPTFRLAIEASSDQDAEDKISIIARFALIYSLDSFDGLEEESIKAFSVTNAIFNAWPYWRELVQSMTSRMLGKSITLGVFRIGENPFEVQSALFGSESKAGGATEGGAESPRKAPSTSR